MEVHHHPHVPNHSKPWKEYLLEGLMIFVAVTLGYGAENIREHYVETKKAIISAGNLYVDVLEDSVRYEQTLQTRYFQDSCYEIIKDIYKKEKTIQDTPIFYLSYITIWKRYLPMMNTIALDEVKNSGTLKFIEDDKLKVAIQKYANMGSSLKLREAREFDFIDKTIDPITLNHFDLNDYDKFYKDNDDKYFQIINNRIVINMPMPPGLKIKNTNKLDLDYIFSALSMLQLIRKGSNRSYIIKTQKQCHELLTLLRNYLREHDALKINTKI
jgi:hypothetical protein